MNKAMDSIVILVWIFALVTCTYALIATRMSPLYETSVSIAIGGARSPADDLMHAAASLSFCIGAPTVDTVSTPVFDKV